jgi:hypothetical protein
MLTATYNASALGFMRSLEEGISWSTTESSLVDADVLFELYSTAYTGAGQKLWFTDGATLQQKYPCVHLMTDDEGRAIGGLMFTLNEKADKVSLFLHNGDSPAKRELMTRLTNLLTTPGTILEASGYVALNLINRCECFSLIEIAVEIPVNQW